MDSPSHFDGYLFPPFDRILCMEVSELQERMDEYYGARDRERGVEVTALWLVEEVGELAEAVRTGEELEKEFADVAAWLASLANLMDVDLEAEFEELYGDGCPDCGEAPCVCPM